MKMLSIHCKVNLSSSEVVFLNNVHEMRSFCALVFKPIVFNDFLLLDSHHKDGISTLAYNSMDWPWDCLFLWHILEDKIWLTLSIHCHSCLLMSFHLSTESLSGSLAFCVLMSHLLPNSLDCRTYFLLGFQFQTPVVFTQPYLMISLPWRYTTSKMLLHESCIPSWAPYEVPCMKFSIWPVLVLGNVLMSSFRGAGVIWSSFCQYLCNWTSEVNLPSTKHLCNPCVHDVFLCLCVQRSVKHYATAVTQFVPCTTLTRCETSILQTLYNVHLIHLCLHV